MASRTEGSPAWLGGPARQVAEDEQMRAFLASIVESSDDSIIASDLSCRTAVRTTFLFLEKGNSGG